MPQRADVFLETALLALRHVPLFLAQRSLSDYLADEMCQSAVKRQLEIAGDALGQLRKTEHCYLRKFPTATSWLRFATFWFMAMRPLITAASLTSLRRALALSYLC